MVADSPTFVDIRGELWELRGDMESGFAYAEMTGGGLEDAFERLRPFLRLVEIPKAIVDLDPKQERYAERLAELEAEHRVLSRTQNDPRPWVELLYAFSAGYRRESGFDAEHWQAADSGLHPLDRAVFKAFLRLLNPVSLRRLRDPVLRHWSRTIQPPTTTGTEQVASPGPVVVAEAEPPSTGVDSTS